MEDERFDELTRKLATPLSRRGALKAFLGVTAGAALLRYGGGRAFADDDEGDDDQGEDNDEGKKHKKTCTALGHKCHTQKANNCCGGGVCVSTGGGEDDEDDDEGHRGVCACPQGTTACSGTCANLQTSAANCGVCGKACPTGYSCVNGTCLNTSPTCTPGMPAPTCSGALANGTCFCESTTEGVSGCFQPAQTKPGGGYYTCTTTADCATSGPPGTFCVMGTAGGVCVAPC